STISTPGMIGRPGKWPVRKGASAASAKRARADRPGWRSMTSSTNRNGARWGRTSAGAGARAGVSALLTGGWTVPDPLHSRRAPAAAAPATIESPETRAARRRSAMGPVLAVILILVLVGLFLVFFVKIAREYER